MILERFYDDRLAQASYLVGCTATGDALVIDPARDVQPYLDRARRHGVDITSVTETHIHADFLSGSRELHARTGATLLLSREGGPDWQYGYAAQDGATLVGDGDQFMVGNVRVQVLHTPGHTPEHVSFLITDTAAGDVPMGVFTGDFLFVGDVGRPDLLEKAARIEGTMERAARDLYRSLRRVDEWPGHLQVWPGHGAGSACGKALGAVPSSTVGYERATNWAFQTTTEDAFVAEVLAGQPEPPVYFAHMKRLNRDGPPILGGGGIAPSVPLERLRDVLDAGGPVIDVRPWTRYRAGHVPRSLHIPVGGSFTTWAGWLVPFDTPYYLIADSGDQAAEAIGALRSIGLDRVEGYVDAPRLARDQAATETIDELTADGLADSIDDVSVIDVRGRSEWEAGHLDGAIHIPLGYLAGELDRVPRDHPVVTQCLSGERSAIAASVLRAHGMTNVRNLAGGIEAWRNSGGAVVTEPAQVLV